MIRQYLSNKNENAKNFLDLNKALDSASASTRESFNTKSLSFRCSRIHINLYVCVRVNWNRF